MRLKIIDRFTFTLTTDVELGSLFEYTYKSEEYDWRIKGYKEIVRTRYLYHDRIKNEYHFKIGWLLYVYAIYGKFIDKNDLIEMSRFVQIQVPFESDYLREDQLKDTKYLLTYRHGLFQNYTGYGKTVVIVELVNYISTVLNEKVIILVPNNATKDTIESRLNKRFGTQCTYYDPNNNINVFNVNGFLRSQYFKKDDPNWKEVKWIISDEVEACVNHNGINFIKCCTNVIGMYGFSGTADKFKAKPILFDTRLGLNETLRNNHGLVDYFGATLIFKKPDHLKINLIGIKTDILDDLNFQDIFVNEDNIYLEIVNKIFLNDKFGELLHEISEGIKFYIPINRTQILDYWYERFFTDRNVLYISGSGYHYYPKNSGGINRGVSMEESQKLVEDDLVDLVLGTKSSFKALDYPKLTNLATIVNKNAEHVIQYVGRTARGDSMDIYYFIPGKKIPVYSRDLDTRLELIRDYYSDCEVTEKIYTLDEYKRAKQN